jgi:hypothetical protein
MTLGNAKIRGVGFPAHHHWDFKQADWKPAPKKESSVERLNARLSLTSV